MKISIILPTKNRINKLHNVLVSFEKQSCKDFEIILVNDGNKNLRISKYKLNLRYYYSGQKGVSVARNIGINNSTGDILIFVGDDTYPEPHFVEEHQKFHEFHKDKGSAMLGKIEWPARYKNNSLYRFLNKGIQFDFSNLRKNEETDIFHFYTSNLSLKKSFIEKFDENMKIPFYEDIELASRLKDKGLKLIYNPKAKMIHDHEYNDILLKKRALLAGKAFRYLQKKIPEIKQPYRIRLNDYIKLYLLFFLRIVPRFRMAFYHYYYTINFLKGYHSK